ncbi:hypothetical protein [Plantactinospora sp. GCM10030261]|uniref:hypothetical protein n=1 Tax=Plantactinospora sp. GCM10030261 TaxID=3273420 RepID=UPI0036204950
MTCPEQLPPGYDLSAEATRRMRERVLAGVTDNGAVGRARRVPWLPPVAVAGAVLLVAGGLGAYQIVGHRPPATGPATTTEAVVADCGTFALDQGERLPAGAVSCFVDAAGTGRPARLTVSTPTAEGDPITESYAADAAGRITVVIDTRRDRYGSPGVSRRTCTGPAAGGDHAPDALTGFSPWLAFDSCSEPTVSAD